MQLMTSFLALDERSMNSHGRQQFEAGGRVGQVQTARCPGPAEHAAQLLAGVRQSRGHTTPPTRELQRRLVVPSAPREWSYTRGNMINYFNPPKLGQWQQSMFPMGSRTGRMMATTVVPSEAAVETSAMETIAMVAAMTRTKAPGARRIVVHGHGHGWGSSWLWM